MAGFAVVSVGRYTHYRLSRQRHQEILDALVEARRTAAATRAAHEPGPKR